MSRRPRGLPLWRRSLRRHGATISRLVAPVSISLSAAEFFVLALRRARLLRGARHVWSQSFYSFGHQTTDPHLLALRFGGRGALLLLSDHGQLNRPLLASFDGPVSVVLLARSRLARKIWWSLGPYDPIQSADRAALRLALRVVGSRAVPVARLTEAPPARVGGYQVEYIGRLNEPGALRPVPRPADLDPVRRALAAHPATRGRWPAALYLRGRGGNALRMRDTPPATYRPLVERLIALGAYVFVGGDGTVRPHFDRAGVVGYGDLGPDRTLVDLYFLSSSRVVVSGGSGPHAIATAFGTPVLITNCGLFYNSGWRPEQQILYKHVRERSTGHRLRLGELFQPPLYEYTEDHQFEDAGLEFIDNTPEELVAALDDMMAALSGDDPGDPDDAERLRRWRALPPAGTVAAIAPGRPVRSYLRGAEW